MRLMNIHSLELNEFTSDIPPYAILSHRWIGEEITYEQYQEPCKRTGPSFQKIADFCRLVRERGSELQQEYHIDAASVHWIWVDTCCIDKRSSAELSEAINSMWKWYRDSSFCVAYLVDVERCSSQESLEADIAASEWFRRGFTLQELLAPSDTLFCNRNWDVLGTKISLRPYLVRASGIDAVNLLSDEDELRMTSVAQRMSWARNRRTSRPEDMAYCLFGLFDVHMPLLYGEGHRAFLRLQEEIVRRSDDESIFAWTHPYRDPRETRHMSGLFAPRPDRFLGSNPAVPFDITRRRSFRVTHKGVEMETKLLRLRNGAHLLRLMCAVSSENFSGHRMQCMLILQKVGEGIFVRKHLTDWEKLGEPYNDLVGAINSLHTVLTDEATICIRDAQVFEEVLDSDHSKSAESLQVYVL